MIRLLVAALIGLGVAAPAAAARDVLYVGNNWDGTADVIDPFSFQRLARMNIVPDKEERMAEIMANPDHQAYFLGIRQLVGEGHDQFVDDMFSSHDGRFLYVSRPSFADVVAFDLRTRKIVWRVPIEGYRADHMAISPDGTRLAVSASTARKVHMIDAAKGRIVGSFESGDQPHENNYSADGSKIFHASIGSVFTPTDDPALDDTKGDRWFEIVDARSLKVLKRLDMGQKLEEAGYPDMSSAVRPMALAPDEKQVYFQVSFFHGFVEYDLVQDKVLRLARPAGVRGGVEEAPRGLPARLRAPRPGDEPGGDEAVRRRHDVGLRGDRPPRHVRLPARRRRARSRTGRRTRGDGRYCFISFSGDDRVSVVSYATEREVASVPVGDHPQRMRMGELADRRARRARRRPRAARAARGSSCGCRCGRARRARRPAGAPPRAGHRQARRPPRRGAPRPRARRRRERPHRAPRPRGAAQAPRLRARAPLPRPGEPQGLPHRLRARPRDARRLAP